MSRCHVQVPSWPASRIQVREAQGLHSKHLPVLSRYPALSQLPQSSRPEEAFALARVVATQDECNCVLVAHDLEAPGQPSQEASVEETGVGTRMRCVYACVCACVPVCVHGCGYGCNWVSVGHDLEAPRQPTQKTSVEAPGVYVCVCARKYMPGAKNCPHALSYASSKGRHLFWEDDAVRHLCELPCPVLGKEGEIS
eukprot:scaffold48085_cov26-Tisochrysis_lutea.AAC.1